MDDEYTSVRFPKALLKEVDEYLKTSNYFSSRLEFMKEAVRSHLIYYKEVEEKKNKN
jgi:metal-responsive CopG/Arc/MetJ family transcriptional regulator